MIWLSVKFPRTCLVMFVWVQCLMFSMMAKGST